MKQFSRMLSAVLLLALIGCGTDDSNDNPYDGFERLESDKHRITNPALGQGELDELVAGNTAFALDLYQQVRGEDGNLFYSPFSISIALGMTFAGARGQTAQEMQDTLHFTLGQAGLHPAFNYLDLELAGREQDPGHDAKDGFKLRVANSIWGQLNESFVAEFLDALAENYGAGLNLLDFIADPELCRLTINTWVEDRTAGRIEDLLPQGSITVDTRMVLTNAIYFKAAWNTPFETDNTADGEFQLLTGGTVTVPMMHQDEMLPYAEGDGYAAVELPYDGEKLSMVVIVPTDLDTFEAGLTADGLDAIIGDLQTHLVTLAMPKFSFESGMSLAQVLADMGMPTAFSAAADFSGIRASGGLMITDVFHKAFVGVDEAGTEAAAATAVVVGETSVPEQAELDVDRPFLFLIRDIPTGAVLFLGRVVDPA